MSHDLAGVVWSVDGVDGGGGGSGRISSIGFYRAPSRVPPSRHVTIAARSASGAHDQRVVRITAAAPPGPSPGTSDYGTSNRVLSAVRTSLQGRLLAASVTPGRAGQVSIRARVGKNHPLGSCKAKTPKGRRFTCRLYVPSGLNLDKLKIVAELARKGNVVAKVSRSGRP